jgi:hypothetical protein
MSDDSGKHPVAGSTSRPASSGADGGSRASSIRDTIFKLPGSREQVPAKQAERTDLQSVTADTVLMDRSGAEQITADRVSMEQSGAKSIDAKSAQLDKSGAVALGADHAVLLHSSAVQVVAEEARLTDSAVLVLSAESATLTDSRVVVFAGKAEGDVNAVLTPLSAAVAGGAFGLVVALVMILLRSRSRSH